MPTTGRLLSGRRRWARCAVIACEVELTRQRSAERTAAVWLPRARPVWRANARVELRLPKDIDRRQ